MTPEETARILAIENFSKEDVRDYEAIRAMETEIENLDSRYRRIATFYDKVLPILVKLAAKGLLA